MKAKYFLLVVIILCFLGCEGNSKKAQENTIESSLESFREYAESIEKTPPNLIGQQGYVIPGTYGDPYGNERFDEYASMPLDTWYINPLKEVGPDNWQPDEDEKVTHKTAVTVVDQNLEIDGWMKMDRVVGTLTVKVDDQNYVIDYENFTLNPYWEKGEILEAVKYGDFIGKFVGDELPVDSDNKWIEIPQGELVLVTEETRDIAIYDVNHEVYSITALVYKELSDGSFGGKSCYFKPESIEYYY